VERLAVDPIASAAADRVWCCDPSAGSRRTDSRRSLDTRFQSIVNNSVETDRFSMEFPASCPGRFRNLQRGEPQERQQWPAPCVSTTSPWWRGFRGRWKKLFCPSRHFKDREPKQHLSAFSGWRSATSPGRRSTSCWRQGIVIGTANPETPSSPKSRHRGSLLRQHWEPLIYWRRLKGGAQPRWFCP
jgi:hypothetical protein